MHCVPILQVVVATIAFGMVCPDCAPFVPLSLVCQTFASGCHAERFEAADFCVSGLMPGH